MMSSLLSPTDEPFDQPTVVVDLLQPDHATDAAEQLS
jgi:hypothetical protein